MVNIYALMPPGEMIKEIEKRDRQIKNLEEDKQEMLIGLMGCNVMLEKYTFGAGLKGLRALIKKMEGELIMATKKGVPKKDGSGKGKRLNQGRGGCPVPKKKPPKKKRS